MAVCVELPLSACGVKNTAGYKVTTQMLRCFCTEDNKYFKVHISLQFCYTSIRIIAFDLISKR